MELAATLLDNPLAKPAAAQLRRGAQDDAALPAPRLRSGGPGQKPTFDLRAAAEQFVATALLTPLMAQVRDDPFKSEMFHGGFTEDAFMRQFDQIIADRLSKRMSLPIVESIYNELARHAPEPEVDVHG